MSSLGAKVMQPHSIQDARLNRINIDVKSSFKNVGGTLITKRKNIINNKIITGISSTSNDAKISLIGVKDKPGVAASIFKPLSKNSINVDMVVQNISANGKETDLTFTIKNEDLFKTNKLLKNNINIKFRDLIIDKNVSKLSKSQLKSCGLSRQKISGIKNLAKQMLDKSFNPKLIKKMSDEEAIIYLSSLRQIGRWSAEMILLFTYNRSNIWPIQDIGLLRAISKNYKKKYLPPEKFVKLLQKKFSPYCSVATWYLWRSIDPEPIQY